MTATSHGRPPHPPAGNVPPRKSKMSPWAVVGLAMLGGVLVVAVLAAFTAWLVAPDDDAPPNEDPVVQAHVYDPGVCGRVDLSAFEVFGVAEDPVDSSTVEGKMIDTANCDVTFKDPDDPRGVGTLRISLWYYLQPDGAAGKLAEAALGPEWRPQPLPSGDWEEGAVGVRVEENGTTVDAAVVARHENLFVDITWFWASPSADLSASEDAVLATATSVAAVA